MSAGGKVKSLTLVVKESDAGKKKLTDTVDEVMGMRMQAVRTEPCVDGNAAIHFEPAPYSRWYTASVSLLRKKRRLTATATGR